MRRSKADIDAEKEFSMIPKIGPSCGAPWYLKSTDGTLLAYAPFVDAAASTAAAIWGNVVIVMSEKGFKVFLDDKQVGMIVEREKRG